MTGRRSKQAVLDEEFLALRARILEIAAGLDRIDRAAGDLGDDARREQLERAISQLVDGKPDRAARVQLLFSRDYDAAWRQSLGL